MTFTNPQGAVVWNVLVGVLGLYLLWGVWKAWRDGQVADTVPRTSDPWSMQMNAPTDPRVLATRAMQPIVFWLYLAGRLALAGVIGLNLAGRLDETEASSLGLSLLMVWSLWVVLFTGQVHWRMRGSDGLIADRKATPIAYWLFTAVLMLFTAFLATTAIKGFPG